MGGLGGLGVWEGLGGLGGLKGVWGGVWGEARRSSLNLPFFPPGYLRGHARVMSRQCHFRVMVKVRVTSGSCWGHFRATPGPGSLQGHFKVKVSSRSLRGHFRGHVMVISKLLQGFTLGHFRSSQGHFKVKVTSRSLQGHCMGHFKVMSGKIHVKKST